MPWVIRDVVRDVNRAVARRWESIDPLLPVPEDLPEGCSAPLVATGPDGRPAGLAVCRHQQVPDDSLNQTWGATHRFVLTARIKDSELAAGLDHLLAAWREHLAAVPAARLDDSAAIVTWPARDVTGVRALQRHGLQPTSVIAARPRGRATTGHRPPNPAGGDVVIRAAGPDDLAAVTELEMAVIRYDANFGAAVLRPSTQALLQADVRARLAATPTWTWLAERGRRAVALVAVQSPRDSAWIRSMTGLANVAYLQTGFVLPAERGKGTGGQLAGHVHRYLDDTRVDLTLLHYAQVNPLSGPFWSRQGYRPLWTSWEVRPAAAIR